MFNDKGYVTVKDQKLIKSEYFWGSESDVRGKRFPVVDIAVDNSSYLCIVSVGNETKGLFDVWQEDVEKFEPMSNPLEQLMKTFDMINRNK